ncbi:hypothetical protein BJ322DRAFT_1025198 [Thelephora terrestris]|uniref:Uncharacterized protein n=1 Tax=Thelephora terrestris TaxID=56493 RepID=A0A9P6H395_9AGAM|nr:hypothetical protein BJ322DRAFT_1025198 [Thelephora terrestris]
MSGLGREFAHGLARRELSSGECHTQTHQQRHEAWESVTPVTSATSVTRDQHHPIGRDSQIACRFFQAFERMAAQPPVLSSSGYLFCTPVCFTSPFVSPHHASPPTKAKGPSDTGVVGGFVFGSVYARPRRVSFTSVVPQGEGFDNPQYIKVEEKFSKKVRQSRIHDCIVFAGRDVFLVSAYWEGEGPQQSRGGRMPRPRVAGRDRCRSGWAVRHLLQTVSKFIGRSSPSTNTVSLWGIRSPQISWPLSDLSCAPMHDRAPVFVTSESSITYHGTVTLKAGHHGYLPSLLGGQGGSRFAPELVTRKRFPFRRYSFQEDGSLVVRVKHLNRDGRPRPYTKPAYAETSAQALEPWTGQPLSSFHHPHPPLAATVSLVPFKHERPFPSGHRGATIWYSTQSYSDVLGPPSGIPGIAGNLYIHKNLSTSTQQIWLFDRDARWITVSGVAKAIHPTIVDRVLSIRSDGSPNWVTTAGFTNVQSRLKTRTDV